MPRTIIIFIIIAFLLQSSCKRKADKYIDISGTILNEQTNNPIVGLSITLSRSSGGSSLGSGGGWSVIETTTTDNNGNYKFYVKTGEAVRCKVDINADPYNSKYSTNWFSINSGDKYSSTIYIYKNATLTVNAVTNNPLNASESIFITLPGIGCKCDYLTTTTAKSGFYNIVTWSVTRNSATTNFQESVYCPVDTTKFYTINY